jgi:hypothetical protein
MDSQTQTLKFDLAGRGGRPPASKHRREELQMSPGEADTSAANRLHPRFARVAGRTLRGEEPRPKRLKPTAAQPGLTDRAEAPSA